MSAVARIIDANANRAREALRVMEDVARYALDDATLCSALKSMRHDLAGALTALPPGWLEANREVGRDVGTSISTEGEASRSGLIDVTVAAGKRLGEALRVIEEASKMIDSTVAQQVEEIRYRAYEVESALLGRLGTGRARQWRVCVLLTESLCARPWEDVLRGAIDGGAECIQVREKQMNGAALARRVERVIEIARPHRVGVIVNDRADVALATHADGVHLGQDDLTVRDVRRMAGRSLLVGVSTHDLQQAKAAVEAGADYCGVGAMFATATIDVDQPVGPAHLQAFLKRFPLTPHLAIGGITLDNIGRLVEIGVQGIAVCAAVCRADRPAEVVRALRAAIDAAGHTVVSTSRRTSSGD